MGFTSATFFSKMPQSSLTLSKVENAMSCFQKMFRIARHDQLARQKCSKLLEMSQAGPKKMLKIAPACSKLLKIAQNVSKCFKMSQNVSKCFKMPQSVSKCLKMGQQVSKVVMCLHIHVRELSLLGIAVAGVYCRMGLRSVSIAPRSCLLLRSNPSIVNFNSEGSLVIRLAAIV